MADAIRRWDVRWADLDPTQGSEQRGRRPVLVISNDEYNKRFATVTILPLTKLAGKQRRAYEFEVVLAPGQGVSTSEASIVMPHQIRAIAKTRLRGSLGELRDAAVRVAAYNSGVAAELRARQVQFRYSSAGGSGD